MLLMCTLRSKRFVERFKMSAFAKLGLSQALTRALSDNNYETPTPIQNEVIPLLLKGKDVVGIAQTGTGKTAAFVLPILEKISKAEQRPRPKTCHALIIVPTRELASQIEDNVAKYGINVPHLRATIVGGMKYPPQIKKMARGLDIMVATPGRLEDHLKSGSISLRDTTTIILDEADQMLDLGFMPAIRRIVAQSPKQRQTVLLSATMPKQIRQLANEILNNPADIAVSAQSQPVERIDQTVFLIEKAEKRPFLLRALENAFRTIVFTRTKHGADQVVKYLAKNDKKASAIHGDKSQGQRQRALEAFRSGKEHILVATDIAARGIDIPEVSLVVNYDMPTVPEAYIHRIGRTARAGREWQAISLCSSDERPRLRDIERMMKNKIPTENVAHSVVMDATGYDPLKGKQVKPTMDMTPAAKPRSKNRDENSEHPLDTRHHDEDGSQPQRPRGTKGGRPQRAGKKPSNRRDGDKTGKPGHRQAKPKFNGKSSEGGFDGQARDGKKPFRGKASGKPGGKPGGRPGGKPGGRPGGKPGGKPADRRNDRPNAGRKAD